MFRHSTSVTPVPMLWHLPAISVVLLVALGSLAHGIPSGPRVQKADIGKLRIREASDALKEGHWSRALHIAQSVTSGDRANPAAHGIMGTVFALTNRQSEATASLEIVKAVKPGAYDARMIEAILLAQDGEVVLAQQALEELLKEERDNPVPQFYLASIHFALDASEPAREAFQDLLKHHPRFAPAWAGLGDLARKSNDDEEAIRCFQEALKLDPDNQTYRRQLIALYAQSGNTEARDEQIKRLVRGMAGVKELQLQGGMNLLLQGSYAEALELVDKALTDYEEFADGHYIRAACLINLGRPAEAEASIKEYLGARPRSPQAHYYAGMCYMAMESWDQARAEFATAARIMPSFERSTANQAVIAQVIGDHDVALNLLAQSKLATEAPGVFHVLTAHCHLAREDEPAYKMEIQKVGALLPKIDQVDGLTTLPDRSHWSALAQARALMIVLYLNAWYERSIEISETILEHQPGDVLALYFRTQAFKKQQKRDEALESLRKLVAASPRWTYPWLEMGAIHSAGKETKLAKQAFEQAIKVDPRCAEAQMGLVQCHEMEKDFAAAVQACLRAIELERDDPNPHFRLAWNYSEHLNQQEEALHAAQRGMTLDPQNPAAFDLLGRIQLRNKRFPESILSFKEALSLAPTNPTFHYHLGLALHQARNLGEAQGALEQALRLSRQFPDAEHATKLLTEIIGESSTP